MQETKLTCRTLSLTDKAEIVAWHYEGEYAAYDFSSLEEMAEQQIAFMAPGSEKNYLGWHVGDTLIGFTNLQEEDTEIFVGIGVNPAYVSQGWGRRILLEAYDVSRQKYPGKPLYLEVRTWNKRAVACYQRAGFVIDGEPYEMTTHMGPGVFYRMVKV